MYKTNTVDRQYTTNYVYCSAKSLKNNHNNQRVNSNTNNVQNTKNYKKHHITVFRYKQNTYSEHTHTHTSQISNIK